LFIIEVNFFFNYLDKSLLMWKVTRDGDGGGVTGTPFKRYTGHSHFVADVTSSLDSRFCITAAWDRTLRLWDLDKGVATRQFIGHTNVMKSNHTCTLISCGLCSRKSYLSEF